MSDIWGQTEQLFREAGHPGITWMFAVDTMLNWSLGLWHGTFGLRASYAFSRASRSFLLWGGKTMTLEKRMKRMASELPKDMETPSPGTQAGNERGAGTAHLIGVAIRPTLLFMTAFALNVTPHEAAHATAGYILGFNSTLYQMWVNPDAAAATPRQLIANAIAGPIFSLAVGLTSWILYRQRYSRKPSGLFFLMLAIVGFYLFLGPVAAATFGGDFNVALRFAGAPKLLMNVISVVGVLILPTMMYFMGKELSSWAPPWFSRSKAVLCITVGPWLIGTVLITLVYLPLPKFLIGPNFAGSVFWIFAVIGVIQANRTIPAARPIRSLTRTDLILTGAAFLMVRLLVHGVRLAH
jgi:hypothetical protein